MTDTLVLVGDIMIGIGVLIFIAIGAFWLFLRRLNRQLESKLKEVMEEIQDRFISLDVEIDNGMYFCYNAKDRSFVCQGRTALEIREAFESRFPNCVAFLNNEEAVPELKKELMELKASEISSSQ